MSEIILNREELLKQTRIEDQRSDLKQHADKMLRDFEKFNNFSSNRAIWELVQNACDLSVKCEITIDYRNEKIAFTHNGKPFETKSLISLIKQVSGKYGDQEDIPEVGKYGTGFLTTHSFGRKFTIQSVLKTGEFYLPINEFQIDRSPKTWELLSDKIAIQKDRVYEILEKESPINVTDIKTTFTYTPETDTEKEYVRVSSLDLDEYIPLVFTVNERLHKITVISNEGVENTYWRLEKEKVVNLKDINLHKTRVATSLGEKWIYSLIDNENGLEIILPIDKDHNVFEFSNRVSRLFLYYPLVGSENFGINFLINCNNFLPNEPRSGIHLKSNKDQVKEQEESNRLIIQKSTDLVFNFLKSNVIEVSNPLLYANVNFNTNSEDSILNEYFQTLQSVWNKQLSSLPFVRTSSGYKEIQDVVFFSKELITDNEVDLKIIYQIASKYYDNIPVIEDILKWSVYATNWNDDDIQSLNHNDLLVKISEQNLGNFKKEELIAYYSYLLTKDKSSVFNEIALLPNINGNFNKLGHLLAAKDLDAQLLSFGQVLISDALEFLIHEDFKFSFDFNLFNRKDFSNKLKLRLEEQAIFNKIYFAETLTKSHYHEDLLANIETVSEDFFIALLNFCKLGNNINSNSKPNQLIKMVSRYYNLDSSLLFLPSTIEETDDLENRVIRKVLVQMFFNLISLHENTWVADNLELLANIASLEDDSYKEAYKSSSIFPNQLFELHKIETLKRDIDVWQDIKEIFEKVNGKDINEVLSVQSFNDFVPEEQFITNKYLTSQIEEKFFEDTITEIENHPYKDVIIKIIPKLTKKAYQDLFPLLDGKKANIMISVITKEETKDDIFAIVTLDESKLKKLGKLVQNENFLDLLNRAALLAIEDQHRHLDFEHKHAIGTYIENKIRERLSEELKEKLSIEKIASDNVQGGQDIIIRYDGEDVHYVEVKSRWDSRNSVSMSKLQLERAATNSEMYSLCSVDVTNFFGEGDKYQLTIDEIIPLTKFVNQIGDNIKPLVEYNLSAEKNLDEKVHLIEYRGIVPQSIIKEGEDFNSFIYYLTNKIQNIV